MIDQKPAPAARPRYWLVLALLVGLTIIEVAASYLSGGIKIPILLTLAGIKAALVILYFMHLKFDSRLYTAIFLFGAFLIIPLLLVFLLVMPNL
jgi:cytochrome c oxidase subunit 4